MKYFLLYCCACMLCSSRVFAQQPGAQIKDLPLHCPCEVINVAGKVLVDAKHLAKGQKIFPDQKIQFLTKGNIMIVRDIHSNNFWVMPIDFIAKSNIKCRNCTPVVQNLSDPIKNVNAKF